MIVRLRCSLLSLFEKRQQIRVDYFFLSRTHAVWKARINLQCRPFNNLRGKQTRCNDGHDLIVVAVKDESRHIELLEILGEISFRKRLDAIERGLKSAKHSL